MKRVTPGCPGQFGEPTFSADGERLAVARVPIPMHNGSQGIYVMNPDGSHIQRVPHSAKYEEAKLSPDGRSVLYDRLLTGSDSNSIFITSVDGLHTRQLTSRSADFGPTFSPDGHQIAFARLHGGGAMAGSGRVDIFTMRRDGSDIRRLTHAADGVTYEDPDFSPDGQRIVFVCGREPSIEVCLTRVNGTHLKRLTQFGHLRGFQAQHPVFSPNGRQIAFLGQYGCRPRGGCGHNPVVLYTMRPDGSHREAIYSFPPSEYPMLEGLSWQSLP